MKTLMAAVSCVLLVCGTRAEYRYDAGQSTPPGGANTNGGAMNAIAEQYVKLVLALGQHDSDYVDAYYGPPEWKKAVDADKVDLSVIASRAAALQAQLA